jgi:hypothetical protein
MTMHPLGNADASLRSLFACWLAFSGQIVQAITAKLRQRMVEEGAEVVKDTILDLDTETAADDWDELTGTQTLPPLNPERLVASLRSQIEQALRQAAEAINEDPCGCWAAVTEERVLALFNDLGHEALAHALELRVAAAEALLPHQQAARGAWAHKYRRMLAAEGRWLPQEEPAQPSNA